MVKKSIGLNTFFNVTYKLLNIIFPLVTSSYLARVLGPSLIGKVDYSRNIMSYFLVVASLGIPTYGMREIANHRNDLDKKNQVFSELFVLNGICSFICSIFYILCVFTINRFALDYKLYLCTGLTLFMNFINVDWVYSGDEEYVYISTRSFVIKVLSIISIFVFVHDENDYIVYSLITSLATTGSYVFNVFNLKKHVKFSVNHLTFHRHIRPILVLFVTLLASDLYNQIDITMLGIHYDDSIVGYYSNAIKLIRIVYSISVTIGATILPRMCLLYKENKKTEFNNLFWRTFLIIFMCALPSLVGIFIVSGDAVVIMFGEKFIPSINIVRILTPIVLIISVSYLIGSVVLTSTNNEKYLLRATISGAIVNIILNAILIPLYSTTGAAIASIIGELVVFMVHFKYGKQYINKSLKINEIAKVLIALFIMGVSVCFIQNILSNMLIRLIVSIFVGVIVYVLALLLVKNDLAIYYTRKIINKFIR